MMRFSSALGSYLLKKLLRKEIITTNPLFSGHSSHSQRPLLRVIAFCFLLSACTPKTPTEVLNSIASPEQATDQTPERAEKKTAHSETTASSAAEANPVDPTLFLAEGLVHDITEEPCTLSGGTQTTCYRITATPKPIDHAAGPWCPETVTASAEEGGIWPKAGELHGVDGRFIENLATFYGDGTWKLYEADGTIRITGSAEQCATAARPNVDEAYQNYCVQCSASRRPSRPSGPLPNGRPPRPDNGPPPPPR